MLDAKEHEELPEETGVYLLYEKDVLLYVGKAVSLRRRVGDHFRTKSWASSITDIDYIPAPSEEEALLLERELIQSRRPKYNIRLRDDRAYPMIAVSLDEEYPRVYITREKRHPERLYFGPWSDGRRARELVQILPQIFPFRSCEGPRPGRQSGNPCLDYHLGRCGAPCVDLVSRSEYRQSIQNIINFLQGERDLAFQICQKNMESAAARQDYEEAALYRDRLQTLRALQPRRWQGSGDIIGVYQSGEQASLSILELRDGLVAEQHNWQIESQGSAKETVEEFLEIYPRPLYNPNPDPELLRWAERDARLRFIQSQKRQGPSQGLREIEAQTGSYPFRIECFDIANLGSSHTVGSMALFLDGQKSRGRTFLLQRDRPDDYQSLREVFEKRKKMWERDGTLPDLLLVDGGRGQLQAALDTLQEFTERGTQIWSLAKREETFWNQKGKIDLPEEASLLLRAVRDEAHRLANSRHRNLRDQETVRSELGELPGVGPRRREALLDHFGSMDALRAATAEEIASVQGISEHLARSIHQGLQK